MDLDHSANVLDRPAVKKPGLARRLHTADAIALSLAIIAPSMAMAFNVTLAAQTAGRAAPLAFAIGTVVLAIVALSFVSFSRRVANAGSALAYMQEAFGPRWGFIGGWTLLLAYLGFSSATAALVGNFIQAAGENYGLRSTVLWVALSLCGVATASLCACRDMRLASRLMLLLEALSVLAILVLSIGVLAHTGLNSAAPFIPDQKFHGWSGVGYGIVFCVLSFAGFEGAATLGEETVNPYRTIPIAILGTCALAGIFYVFVSYSQVIGYGAGNANELAKASAPLNDLAVRYMSKSFATAIDVAAAISAFSCVLGALNAAARVLFALGRGGLAPRIGEVHPVRGTPVAAILICTAVPAVGVGLVVPFTGLANFAGYLSTIGSLALILVYIGVTVAQAKQAFSARRALSCIGGVLGTVLLLWPLYNSVYPAPASPNDWWPYLVVAWVIAGGALSISFSRRRLSDG